MRYFLTNGNLKSLFIILCIALSAAVEAQTTLYVAPSGNDANAGTETSPLATIAGARDKIRAIKTASDLPEGGITVYFRDGIYSVTETTEFTADDSGTAQSPIIYTAYQNETPVFTGGSYISGSDFVSVTDQAMRSRLDPSVQDKVLCYDLFAHGFTYDELDYAKDFWKTGNLLEHVDPKYYYTDYLSPRMQVFINDEALYLARYPNKTEGIFVENPYNKYLMISPAEVVETGFDDITEQPNNELCKFKTHADRIKNWKNFEDIVIFGMPGWEFFVAEVVAENIDPETMTVTLRHPGNSGVSARGRYAFANVFEELDTPGEYFIDKNTGVLYLYPTTDMENATVKISRFEEDFMIKAEGASFLTFSGLTFELTKNTVLCIQGGESCSVENCVVKNYGGDGVRLGWSTMESSNISAIYGTDAYDNYLNEPTLANNGLNHKIASCTFLNTGRRAAVISSGSVLYRQPSNMIFENNVVKHSGLIGSCYFSGVTLEGCGITVKNNAFMYCRGQAIRGNIVDTEIINNEFCDSPCDMAEDTSTIYLNYTCINDGVKVRYNYFHDVTNRGHLSYGFGFARRGTGVGYDNMQPFKDFSYNVVYNAPGSGLNATSIEPIANIGNIIIDCDYLIQWPYEWLLYYYSGQTGEEIISSVNTLPLYYKNGIYKDPLWRANYPDMYEYYEYMLTQQRVDSLMTDLRGNLAVFLKKRMIDGRSTDFPLPGATLVDTKYGRLENNHILYEDPGFANKDAYDFQLPKEVADAYGLEWIDMSKIGVPDLPKPARVSDSYEDSLRWTAPANDRTYWGNNAHGIYIGLPDDTESITMVSVFRLISPGVWQWELDERLNIGAGGDHFVSFLGLPGETYTLFYPGDANYPPQFLGGKDGTSPPEDVLTFKADTVLNKWANYQFGLVKQRPAPEMDNRLVSVMIDDVEYERTPINVITDQVFHIRFTVGNTGTATWGVKSDSLPDRRGAMLFSHSPEYNINFGTYLINPGIIQTALPGEIYTYNAYLRAPSEPGNYTMAWRAKDCMIGDLFYSGIDYHDFEWFGEVFSVDFTVTQRAETPPEPPARVQGVVDASDLEYVGSFTVPDTPDVPPQFREKTYFESGITMRNANGEKRLLMATGTYSQMIYEVAIPEPVKIVGNDASGIPVAPYRSAFGEIARADAGQTIKNGTMWYDDDEETLYWTNYGYYDNSYDVRGYPMLRSAKLVDGVLVPAADWYMPEGVQMKAFWGGVTSIPQSFADQYTEGRRLAMGFGGNYAINAGASWGPALAAVSLPNDSEDELDMLPVFRHTINNRFKRDGNYFGYSEQPKSPWEGTWTDYDVVRSGVFIDLPDKKGYVTFARLGTGRINYDLAGKCWEPHNENQWYFYDWETLGNAATGEIYNTQVTPSSISTVTYPYEARANEQWVTGSCFDPETRRLYLYTLQGYNRPIVHVYRVSDKTAIAAAPLTGVTSPVEAATPSTAIDNGDGFTAALSWDGNPSVFAGNAVYTATITLTAADDHEFRSAFNSVAAIAGFTVNGSAPSAFVSNDGATLVFKIAFPRTTLGKVAIVAAPLTGVTSPVEAATPSTAINNGDGFTAALSWDGNPSVFAGNTVYTATITLTADENHEFPLTFNSVAAIAGFTVNGSAPSAFVSNDGATLAFKVAFPQTTLSNEPIAAIRIWTNDNRMYIVSSTSGEAKVYNVAGQLVKTVPYIAGRTATAMLPRGAYIVKVGDGCVNKVIIQ